MAHSELQCRQAESEGFPEEVLGRANDEQEVAAGSIKSKAEGGSI